MTSGNIVFVVVNNWNSLPDYVVLRVIVLNSFNNRLHKRQVNKDVIFN